MSESNETKLRAALVELITIVRIHQDATDNQFAWAELEQAEEVLSGNPTETRGDQAPGEPVATIRIWHKGEDQHAELVDWEDALESLADGIHLLFAAPQLVERKAQPVSDNGAVDAALEDYLGAQDALDNREYGGLSAEPYETLMQRRNAARRDLDDALSASQANGKSEAVAYPATRVVFAHLIETMSADNGCEFGYSEADFREAQPAIRELVKAGFFGDDPSDLDGSYWQCIGHDEDDAAAYFERAADAYAALDAVLNRIFDTPMDADRAQRPAAPAAETEIALPAVNFDPQEVARRVCREVSEMDDRTSPEDWPEAMLVTGDELFAIVIGAFADSAQAAPAADAAVVAYPSLSPLPDTKAMYALRVFLDSAERMDLTQKDLVEAVFIFAGANPSQSTGDSVRVEGGYEHQRAIMEAERNDSLQQSGFAATVTIRAFERGFTNGWDRRGTAPVVHPDAAYLPVLTDELAGEIMSCGAPWVIGQTVTWHGDRNDFGEAWDRARTLAPQAPPAATGGQS